MDTSAPTGLSLRARAAAEAAFSLVEVTLAVGIVAFAFMAVFGLIPTGLNIFRQTMDTSTGSGIAQRVLNEAKQDDFVNLISLATGSPGETFRAQTSTLNVVRYFDDQGNELYPAGANAAPPAGTVYQVNTRVMPGTMVYSSAVASPSNDVLATVTVQVAYNPGNLALNVVDSSSPNDTTQPLRNLWDGTVANSTSTTPTVPVWTWSTMVARNK